MCLKSCNPIHIASGCTHAHNWSPSFLNFSRRVFLRRLFSSLIRSNSPTESSSSSPAFCSSGFSPIKSYETVAATGARSTLVWLLLFFLPNPPTLLSPEDATVWDTWQKYSISAYSAISCPTLLSSSLSDSSSLYWVLSFIGASYTVMTCWLASC